jgi:hypothetical protein
MYFYHKIAHSFDNKDDSTTPVVRINMLEYKQDSQAQVDDILRDNPSACPRYLRKIDVLVIFSHKFTCDLAISALISMKLRNIVHICL